MEEEYLDVAKRKTRLLGLRNVRFILGRAEDVLPDGTFDCIVSSYLAKYADLAVLVANAAGMLAPGGALVMHDFAYPRNPVFLRLWLFYFTLLRTVGSRFYPEWRPAFEGLPELIATPRGWNICADSWGSTPSRGSRRSASRGARPRSWRRRRKSPSLFLDDPYPHLAPEVGERAYSPGGWTLRVLPGVDPAELTGKAS